MKAKQYSGIISKPKLEQLTQQINKQIQCWSEQWFSESKISVDIDFENKTLFSNKTMISSNDLFWKNTLACCQFKHCTRESLVKLALKLTPTTKLNEIDQQLVNFVANGMSLTLNTGIMEILSSENNELLGKKQNNFSQEKQKDINICLSFTIVFNNFSLSLSFSDEFLFLYQSLNTVADSNKLKAIKISESLANKPVTFSVDLPLPKLSFSQLSHLKKGQVIKLEQSLAQPLVIKHGKNVAPFKGFLIKKGVQKAVYLSGK